MKRKQFFSLLATFKFRGSIVIPRCRHCYFSLFAQRFIVSSCLSAQASLRPLSTLFRWTSLQNPLFLNGQTITKLEGAYSQIGKRHYSPQVNDEYRRKYVPRRGLMYVPASEDRKIAKIPTLGVDSVVLDCEDGVAVNKKEEARKNVRMYLDNNRSSSALRTELTVRVNSVQSGLCQADLETILPARYLPSSILVPKVDGVDHLKWFAETATRILGNERNIHQKINLIIFVESAMSLLSLPHICQTAWDLSPNSHFVPDAIVFGSDDYCADIGATRTNDASEIAFARQHIVMVAKAFKLQAIDIVYIDYKDLDGLRRQSVEGAQMGFTGKQIIHPTQIPICQEAFSPTPAKIEWARQLIEGFDKHQKSGKGAYTFQGQMIDMPLVLQARNIMQLAEIVKKATRN